VNREDMLDRHSYDKDGRVLHMLRGAWATMLFGTLNRYLTEISSRRRNLQAARLSKLTGRRPDVVFSSGSAWASSYASPHHQRPLALRVQQTQDTLFPAVYRLPVTVAVWTGSNQPTEAPSLSPKPLNLRLPPAGSPCWSRVRQRASYWRSSMSAHHRRADIPVLPRPQLPAKSEVLDLLQNKTAEGFVREDGLLIALNDRVLEPRRLALVTTCAAAATEPVRKRHPAPRHQH
jgi:aminopeptidase N